MVVGDVDFATILSLLGKTKMTAIPRFFCFLVIAVVCVSGGMQLSGATGDDINIRFMIDNSDGMQRRDIAKTSAALLAAEIDDFIRNSMTQKDTDPTNLRILVDAFRQKGNAVKTEAVFDYRLGQKGRLDYKGLRKWNNKWFVEHEVTLDRLINRNWPTDNKNTILIVFTNTSKGINGGELSLINTAARQVNSGLYIIQLPTGKEVQYRDDNVLNAELAKRIHATFELLRRTLESYRFSMLITVKVNGEMFNAAEPIVAQAPVKIELAATCTGTRNFFWRQDGRQMNGKSIEYQINDVGRHVIKAVGIDLTGGEHVQAIKIDVQPPPDAIADFSVFPTSGLTPLTVSVTNKSTNASKFQWNWGDGSAETEEREPQHTYDRPGQYTISLNVLGQNGDNCRKEITVVVHHPAPVADFQVADGPHDNGKAVEFVNKSRNANRLEWDFGDGTPVEKTENPTHVFKEAGSYRVVLKAFSPDGTIATDEKTVNIRQSLKASFRWDSDPNTREIIFRNTSSGWVRCRWIFGDGTDSTDDNPRHGYTTNITRGYEVRLTVFSDDGREDSATQTVNVTASTMDDGEDDSESQSLPEQDWEVTTEDDGGSSGMGLLLLAVLVLGGGVAIAWLLKSRGTRFTVRLYSRERKLLGQKVVIAGQILPITDIGGNNDLSMRIIKAEDDSGDEYMVSFRKPDESAAVVQQKAVKLGVTDSWSLGVDLSNLTVDNGRLEISEGVETEEGD